MNAKQLTKIDDLLNNNGSMLGALMDRAASRTILKGYRRNILDSIRAAGKHVADERRRLANEAKVTRHSRARKIARRMAAAPVSFPSC